ncbi:MAG: O-6-methylguanine DNA methyltransferase [Candidatus Deianiraeaceae bacterium]|jgi:O-6-methylguanine DNA methyltransferase
MTSHAIIITPYGKALIAMEGNFVVCLLFLTADEQKMLSLFRSKFPDSKELNSQQFDTTIHKIFNNTHIDFKMHGTDFQKSVWKELIKLDSVTSYQELAHKIQNSKAVRAVANAVAKNLLHFIVPCHLIVRSNGSLGKYAGGLTLKQELTSTKFPPYAFHFCE